MLTQVLTATMLTVAVAAAAVVLLSAVHRCVENGRRWTSQAAASGSRGNETPLLYRMRGLRKDYTGPGGTVTALRETDADVGSGMTAILGVSGEGKSTLLNCIGGLDSPTKGVVIFKGTRLPTGDPRAMRFFRATKVAFVLQDRNLITHQTVEENAALPLLCRGVSRREALAAARKNLELVGIGDLAGRHPHQLSGGQKQRVAIARALTSGAEVILADEPTGSLDPKTSEGVMRAFRNLSQRMGTPVVLVTHNHGLAHKYCDRVIELTSSGLVDITRRVPRREPMEPAVRAGRTGAAERAVTAGPKRRTSTEKVS